MLLLCTSTACVGEFDSRFPAQVRDSSEESKRSFLVSKGLTEEEIEAAFIRVGPTSSASDVKGGLSTPPKPWEKGGAMVPAPPAKKPIRWTQVRQQPEFPGQFAVQLVPNPLSSSGGFGGWRGGWGFVHGEGCRGTLR